MEALTYVITALVGFAVAALYLAITGEKQREHAAALSRISSYPSTPTQHVFEDTGGSVLRDRPKAGNPILRLLLGGDNYAEAAATELAAANLNLGINEYITIRAFAAVALAVPAVVIQLPLIGIPLAIIGFQIPRFYVQRRQRGRLAQFDEHLVDAISLMANALKSGSSFLQAVSTVTQEFEGPIKDEFGQVVAEISIGTSVDAALENLMKRVHSYDLFLAVTAMLVQRQTGGNLAEILEKIANTIRERMRLMRQVRVLTAQERMSAIVVGSLPVCLLILFTLLNPAYPRPFFDTSTGRMVLGAAFGFEAIGFVILNQMAKLEV